MRFTQHTNGIRAKNKVFHRNHTLQTNAQILVVTLSITPIHRCHLTESFARVLRAEQVHILLLCTHLFEGVRVINSIAAGHEKINEENLDKLKRLFHDFVFDILGLQSETDNNASNEALGKVIDAMMNVRKAARANKDWTTSDRIRDELKNAGIQIKDTKEGYEWSLLED